ncbi:DUF1850 domain-containing protein [Alkalibacillus almallahensis]|uniref:DUF1850 domain-containing protein n=1 Tax=Alkalibacillus almallahensis TaxID=1379154 RepID=UPI0014231185|nr:DUF1850 domain-containing protein [Alkalibacillus almallahensis]NIK11778.1 hypothetical protein [Alkalibacillus almallahensis]
MNNKVLLGSALILALLFLTFYHQNVTVIETDDDTYYLNDKSFTLTWIHSVENEPWYEVYERQDNHFVLTETYFKTFGAGVPSDGEIIESDDDFIHMKINRSMDEVNIIVSENAETTLITGDKEIPLYNLVDHNHEVSINTRHLYFWNMWGGTFI